MSRIEPIHPDSYADFLTRDELARIQLARLQENVALSYAHVDLTRRRMQASGIKPEDIRSLADLVRLPFMEKSDLRDTYPYGLFACPMRDVVRLHVSSGTTGKPIVVGYTADDLKVWTSVMSRTLSAAGVSQGDIIQNCFGYGLFTGGLGAHYGAEALGATVIPISGGNTERQLMVMQDFGVTCICSTPSYFLHLIEAIEATGSGFKNLKLRVGVFGAEPWTDGMRAHIQDRAGIKAFDIYGLSEIIGPGVATECACQCGLHVFEDHFLMEIVVPKTDQVLPDGEEGELVLTTLSKQAMPMLRYRTHDITSIIPEPCACGRTLRRIRRISHRSDDMLIIRGINVFPSQIEAALLKVENTLPHYQILLTSKQGLDQIEVQVEITEKMFRDRVSALEQLQKKLTNAIEHVVGLRIEVRLVEPQTIARSQGKAKRVIDQRTEGSEG
ncbi:MAG: phenylacetate--CoA ligase [bacterium]